MIRPQPCRWFEVVVARDDAFIALEALAGAGTAEIEWHTHDSIAAQAGRPDELLKRYAALAQACARPLAGGTNAAAAFVPSDLRPLGGTARRAKGAT